MTQTSDQQNAEIIRAGFWLVLGRAISEAELRDQLRAMEASDEGVFVLRLLSSPEFRLLRLAWLEGGDTERDPQAHESGLRSLGSDEWFVDHAYRYFLGRQPDAVGRASLLAALGEGQPRVVAVRAIALSEEFANRYRELSPDGGFVPRDVQLCELANPAKWDNPDWIALLRDLKVGGDHKLSMHRKSYEFTQLVFGLQRLGFLDRRHQGRQRGRRSRARAVLARQPRRPGRRHRHVRGHLADRRSARRRRAGRPAAGGLRAVSVPPRSADVPEDGRAAPGVRRRRRSTSRTRCRRSSISAASTAPATRSTRWRACVRPGGILAIATEYLARRPRLPRGAFSRDEIHALFDRPGLRLVQPIDDRVWERYQYVEVDLLRATRSRRRTWSCATATRSSRR